MFGRRERTDSDGAVSTTVQIVVVESEPLIVERVSRLFEHLEVKRVGHVDDAIKTARQPTVVVVAPDHATPETLDRIELLRRTADSAALVTVLLLVTQMSTAIMRQAMRAGVSDVLPASGPDAELADLVRSGIERVEHLGLNGDGTQRGRVVAVFSPKGGAGTTTVAVNLAIAASRGGSTPILVDADLPFGDVAITLGLDPTVSLADATGADMDQLRLRGLLVTENGSGLRTLLAPADPARAEVITAADVTRTLELCRQISPLVVVDTSSAFDEVTLSILDQADDVVVVASPDVSTVKNAKVALDTLQRLGVGQSHTFLVLNRVPARPLLAIGDVERVLGLKAITIPDDDAVAEAAHAGRPLVRDTKSKAAKAIAALAVQFEDSPR